MSAKATPIPPAEALQTAQTDLRNARLHAKLESLIELLARSIADIKARQL